MGIPGEYSWEIIHVFSWKAPATPITVHDINVDGAFGRWRRPNSEELKGD